MRACSERCLGPSVRPPAPCLAHAGRRTHDDVARVFECSTDEIRKAESRALRRLRSHVQIRSVLRENVDRYSLDSLENVDFYPEG